MGPAGVHPRSVASDAPVSRRGSLSLAISPYHLSTREAPAMLALMLAELVVTLLPEPPAGDSREAVKHAAHNAPRFLRLMDSWKWSGPLWESGVLAAGVNADLAIHHLPAVYSAIRDTPALAQLRPLTAESDQRRSREPVKALDALCSDLLRGGPDPGINVPVTAALDHFCVSHGVLAVRSAPTSVAQRAEMFLAKKLFAFSIPTLLRAGGGRMMTFRRDLRPELLELRAAISGALPQGAAASAFQPDPQLVQRVVMASRSYAGAFEAWSVLGASGDDENDQRVVAGYVSVTAVVLPGDAALRSAQAAARSMAQVSSGVPDRPRVEAEPPPLVALIVREMNARPE